MKKEDFKNKAECSSCIHFQTCVEELKGQLCKKYKTNIILIFNGHQIRFQCIPNDRWSEWYASDVIDKIDTYPEMQIEVAQALGVRPKDIWFLLEKKNPVPKTRADPAFPDFDLDDDKNLDKQHVRFTVAQWLLGTYHFATMLDTRETYVYSEGIYEPGAEELIVAAIRRALDKKSNVYDRNETIAMVQDNTLLKRSVFHHNPDNKKICLQNGVFNLDTQEFRPHNPLDYFLTKLPVKFDPAAQCPKIDKFFHEIVIESDVATLYEMIGYCLLPAYPIHKGFMLLGGGANGKDTFLNLVKIFLGPKNCSSISLQQLGRSRFSTSFLPGKYANICSDLSDIALKQTGTFKMLTGDSLIGAEVKFGKSFTFENKAKLLFSANKMPFASDDSDAYYRRWLIVKFPNTFNAYSDPKADLHILEKLRTPRELSGLLNRVVKALEELLDRGKFRSDKPTNELRIEIIRESDPIGAFVLDELMETNDPNNIIPKAALHQKYVTYCLDHKLPRTTSNMFSRLIVNYFRTAYDNMAMVDRVKCRVWRRLTWKKSAKKEGGMDAYTSEERK